MTPGPSERSVLDAALVTYGPLEPGVEHVGWSSDGGGGPHLVVMRNFSDAEGYCLVTQDGTFYGGVEGISVTANETRLLISHEAADALGTATELVLRDVAGRVDVGELRRHLERLLGADSTGP
jgi:hypothetical protein